MLSVTNKPFMLWHYAICRYDECHFAECRYAQCHFAECRYAQCHYADRRYAVIMQSVVMLSLC